MKPPPNNVLQQFAELLAKGQTGQLTPLEKEERTA